MRTKKKKKDEQKLSTLLERRYTDNEQIHRFEVNIDCHREMQIKTTITYPAHLCKEQIINNQCAGKGPDSVADIR